MRHDVLMNMQARMTAMERTRELQQSPYYAQTGGGGRGSGTQTWVGRITDGGPDGQPDFSDERYWVVEVEAVDVDEDGKPCFRDKPYPYARHVVAINLTEMGVVPGTDSGSGSVTERPCSQEQSGSASALDGQQYDGFHGIRKAPSRSEGNERFVTVTRRRTLNGKHYHTFESVPGSIVPKSYYFDAGCLEDSTCPDGTWWKGYLIMAVEDDEAGDQIPAC